MFFSFPVWFHSCFESTSFISFITKAKHAIEKSHPVLWALPHFLPETDKCCRSILHTLERACCSCGLGSCHADSCKAWSSLRPQAADTTQTAYGQNRFFSHDLSLQPRIFNLIVVSRCSLCASIFQPVDHSYKCLWIGASISVVMCMCSVCECPFNPQLVSAGDRRCTP